MGTKRTHETTLSRRVIVMTCDAIGCLRQVRRAPRIIIPMRTDAFVFTRPIGIMTTLHYCDHHAREGLFHPGEYLTDKRKRAIEELARHVRPIGYRPDFEAAAMEMVLVTTPEYLRFLRMLVGKDAHVVGQI